MDATKASPESAPTRRTNRKRADQSGTRRPMPPRRRRIYVLAIAGTLLLGAMISAYVTSPWWLPNLKSLLSAARQGSSEEQQAGHEASAHGNGHVESSQPEFLLLTEQGKKNVGLQLRKVQPQDFDRTINVPAMIQERVGRTEIMVSAPMTGIVTRIYPIRGEAVASKQPLFKLRLTHEDLVDTQSAFLETVEQLDVIQREVARLDKVTASGAIAGKRLLEREYEQQQAEARLRAQRQALILHGLTDQQVDEIRASRKLLQEVTVSAPHPVEPPQGQTDEHLLQISQIQVGPGELVEAGDPLCVLNDHAVLYIEGKAFEEDSGELNEAANLGVPVTAVIEANGNGPHTVTNLKILYVENRVEEESRALRFYIRLPNELVRNERTDDGHQFIGWRFKPGQRVQLFIPVERWKDRIVLPVDAVVKEGADWFVFQQNGGKFDRKPVHVEYRDQRWAVIENDGTLYPGDVVAVSGAYQMHLAMKNKAGGGVDPHAGHHH